MLNKIITIALAYCAGYSLCYASNLNIVEDESRFCNTYRSSQSNMIKFNGLYKPAISFVLETITNPMHPFANTDVYEFDNENKKFIYVDNVRAIARHRGFAGKINRGEFSYLSCYEIKGTFSNLEFVFGEKVIIIYNVNKSIARATQGRKLNEQLADWFLRRQPLTR